jgi:nucleotide-binding universal stress UspA family protein
VFHRIVVPVDLSNRNIPALEVAIKLALHNRARVTLLHVIEMLEDSTFEELAEFYHRLEKQARDKMKRLADELIAHRLDVHQDILYGKRAEQIISYSVEHQIDLIVLSSHKIDLKYPGEGWGTISYKVGILSQCPVLLVK